MGRGGKKEKKRKKAGPRRELQKNQCHWSNMGVSMESAIRITIQQTALI